MARRPRRTRKDGYQDDYAALLTSHHQTKKRRAVKLARKLEGRR